MKPEFIEPNERVIEIVQAILYQHDKILNMHKTLIERLAMSPMMYIEKSDETK